jgi:hypothetical protein
VQQHLGTIFLHDTVHKVFVGMPTPTIGACLSCKSLREIEVMTVRESMTEPATG